MLHLVFHRADGTATAVPVNDLSTVHVQTWTPPVFGEGGIAPTLVEDQTVALNDVVSVTLGDPGAADVLQTGGMLEPISDEDAARLEAQFETVPLKAPWEDA